MDEINSESFVTQLLVSPLDRTVLFNEICSYIHWQLAQFLRLDIKSRVVGDGLQSCYCYTFKGFLFLTHSDLIDRLLF